jgi:hypothetical protein
MENQDFPISVDGSRSYRFLLKCVKIFMGYIEGLIFLYYESVWQKTEIA